MRTGKVGGAQDLIRWTVGTLADSLKTTGPVTWMEPLPCPGGPHNPLSQWPSVLLTCRTLTAVFPHSLLAWNGLLGVPLGDIRWSPRSRQQAGRWVGAAEGGP